MPADDLEKYPCHRILTPDFIAAEAQHSVPGALKDAPTIQDVYSAADKVLKERFGQKKSNVDQDTVQSLQRQYFRTCMSFARANSDDPQALMDLMVCVKRARPVTAYALIADVEDFAVPLAHLFTLEQASSLVSTLNTCASAVSPASPRIFSRRCLAEYGGRIAAKFCSRWTSKHGLRDLQASGALQKVLHMFSVAASTGHASNEHAHIMLRYLDTRKDEVTFPVLLGLTKALRDANVLGTASDLQALLQALHDSLHSQSNPLAALPASSTDAAFLLCRLDTLGLRPEPGNTNTKRRDPQSSKSNNTDSRGSVAAQDGVPREEVPLAELLTRRIAMRADEVPPGLLVCATLASSTLLGYMHVPLVKATVRRLNDPLAVRLLDVAALQAALQTLTASRQLASYNKLQGTIVRETLKQRGQAKASQADYLTARRVADSSPLPVSREALCGAVGNVLSVLCLHMRLTLDDEGLATLPPPPLQLCTTVRSLPSHLLNSAEQQPANVWISLLFDATRMDLWASGHAALARELMWSQAALMRMSWQVLAEEVAAASEGPSSAPLSTPARALQRLLWCHAHHDLPFPEHASHMVADVLVPRLHNLACDEVSVTFWSMANLKLRHADLATGLTTAVRRHLESMHADEAAHILASMAALSVRDVWLVDSLCTVLLNRLHKEDTLRPGLAVSTLSAIATYRVCPVKLVGVLYNRVLFQKAVNAKGPQRLRRLPPYALADVALAVADLHSHCNQELGKLPHILPIIKQATAEALSAGPDIFTAEDLEKLRHFCVVTSHSDIVVDVMTLLKQRASEPPTPMRPSLSRARTAELASYLHSRRGVGASSNDANATGYKHVEARSNDKLLTHDAPLPLAAARAPSPHVGQAVVLEFDDVFSTDAGLNEPVGNHAMHAGAANAAGLTSEPYLPQGPTAASSELRNGVLGASGKAVRVPKTRGAGEEAGNASGSDGGQNQMHVPRPTRAGANSKHRHVAYKPATPAKQGDVSTQGDAPASSHGHNASAPVASSASGFDWSDYAVASFEADSTVDPPSKPSASTSPSVFAVVDSKKQSAAETARAISRGKKHGAKPELQRPSARAKGANDSTADAFGVGMVLPAGPGGSVRGADVAGHIYSGMHDSNDAEGTRRESQWREGTGMKSFTPDAAQQAEIARFEQLMHDESRYSRDSPSGYSQKFESSESDSVAAKRLETAEPAAVSKAPLKPRPSHTPAQSEEEVALNQQAIDAAAAEFKFDVNASTPPVESAESDTVVSASASATQSLSAEEAAMRAAAAWPAAVSEEDYVPEGPSSQATEAVDSSSSASKAQKQNQGTTGGKSTGDEVVSWLEQIKNERMRAQSQKKKPSHSTTKAPVATMSNGLTAKNAQSHADGSKEGVLSSRGVGGGKQADRNVRNGATPASVPAQNDSMPAADTAKMAQLDEADVWSIAATDTSTPAVHAAPLHDLPEARNAPEASMEDATASQTQVNGTHASAAAAAEDIAERSESGEIVFDSEGQPQVVTSRVLAKEAEQASSSSNAATVGSVRDEGVRQTTLPSSKKSSKEASSASTVANHTEGSNATTVSRAGSRARASAPQHSFFNNGATPAEPSKTVRAAAAKKPAKAAVATQQVGSNKVQAAGKKKYNFPHFDKFAKRGTHVDMDVLTEIAKSLTPGTPMSSIASTPETAMMASGAGKPHAPTTTGENFKRNKAGVTGARFKQNKAAAATAAAAVPAGDSSSSNGSVSESSTASAVPETSAAAPSAASDPALKGKAKAAAVTVEAAESDANADVPSPTSNAGQARDSRPTAAAGSEEASGSLQSSEAAAVDTASASASAAAKASRTAASKPAAVSTSTTAAASAAASSAKKVSTRSRKSESPVPQKPTNAPQGNDLDDFAAINATGAVPQRSSSTDSAGVATGALHPVDDQKNSQSPSKRTKSTAQSKLAEALRNSSAPPSMFDDGVDETMLKNVEVDSDDEDFSSIELDQGPPASPADTKPKISSLAAALRQSAAAAKSKSSSSSAVSASAASASASSTSPAPSLSSSSVPSSTSDEGFSGLHADGRPMRRRATPTRRKNDVGHSDAKSWRESPTPTSTTPVSAPWRDDPNPTSSRPDSSDPKASSSDADSAAAAAMKAAADDLKAWKKPSSPARASPAAAAAAQKRTAARVSSQAGSAAAAAKERMLATMKSRGATANKKSGDAMQKVREAVMGKDKTSQASAIARILKNQKAHASSSSAAATTGEKLAHVDSASADQKQHKDTEVPASSSVTPTMTARESSVKQKLSGIAAIRQQSDDRKSVVGSDVDVEDVLSLVRSQSSSKGVEEVEVAEVVGKEEYARKQEQGQQLQMHSDSSGGDGAGFGGLDMSRLEELMNSMAGSGEDSDEGEEGDDDETMQAFAEMLQGGAGGGNGVMRGQDSGVDDDELRQMWELMGSAGDSMGDSGMDYSDFESFMKYGQVPQDTAGPSVRGRKAGQGRARRQDKAKRANSKGFGGGAGSGKQRDGKSSRPVARRGK